MPLSGFARKLSIALSSRTCARACVCNVSVRLRSGGLFVCEIQLTVLRRSLPSTRRSFTYG